MKLQATKCVLWHPQRETLTNWSIMKCERVHKCASVRGIFSGLFLEQSTMSNRQATPEREGRKGLGPAGYSLKEIGNIVSSILILDADFSPSVSPSSLEMRMVPGKKI